MSLYPYFSGVTPATAAALPVDGTGKHYVSRAAHNQIMDNFINVKFDVNYQDHNISGMGLLTFGAAGGIVQDAWSPVTVSSGYSDVGVANGFGFAFSSRKDKQNRVQVRFVLQSGSGGGFLGGLPAAHQPAATRQLLGYNGNNGAALLFVVDAGGGVYLMGGTVLTGHVIHCQTSYPVD